MKNIKDEMLGQSSKTLMRYDIFLTTYMAIFTLNNGSAVQTILFSSFWLMRHAKFFLKIGHFSYYSLSH